jgi:hypothetical protein
VNPILIRSSPLLAGFLLNCAVAIYLVVRYSSVKAFVEIGTKQPGELVVISLGLFFMVVINICMFVLTALALASWWRGEVTSGRRHLPSERS